MKILYVHFPKAGGSSIVDQLKIHFSNELFLDYDHDPIVDDTCQLPSTPPLGTVAVCGHLHPLRYIEWSEFSFTFLRNPVDNIISIYYFWKSIPQGGNEIHNKFIKENPNILEFVKSYPIRHLASLYYFNNFNMDMFNFVGIHEDRKNSFKILSKKIGIELNDEHLINKTDQKYDKIRDLLYDDSSVMSTIEFLLADEIHFYEKAKEKYYNNALNT